MARGNLYDLVFEIRATEKDREERPWVKRNPEAVLEPRTQREESYRDHIYRLQREIRELRNELAQLKTYRKKISSDLKFIQADVIGVFFRQKKDVWMINAGKDIGVRRGDLLVQGESVVGQVIDVAKTSSLIESMTAIGVERFVKIDGLKGEHFLQGEGVGQAYVLLQVSKIKNILKRKVYLSRTWSLGGHYVLGEVSRVEKKRGSEQLQVSIISRKIDMDAPLFVAQELEVKDKELFMRRNRLSQLKEEMERIKRQKLQLELLRK